MLDVFRYTGPMTHKEIRDSFIQFFKEKGHAPQPSSSLVPEGDSSVLFTTAGMQQFKPFYTGTPSPAGDKLCSVQKCLRTSDIEEVGDETHLTFFEMLGNFAFNSAVSKKEAISWAYEYMTDVLGLTIDYVTIFGGDDITPRDDESEAIWREVDANLDIREEGREDVFWGPTGNEGPCGPTTEIYVNGVEIWNIVFNEYYCDTDQNYTKLDNFGIDTGMGLERLLVQVESKKNPEIKNVFDTSSFRKMFNMISGAAHDFSNSIVDSRKDYYKKVRVICDHLRAIMFLVSDGVESSNNDRGFILKKLIKNSYLALTYLSIPHDIVGNFIKIWIADYEEFYPELKNHEEKIIKCINDHFSDFESKKDLWEHLTKKFMNKLHDKGITPLIVQDRHNDMVISNPAIVKDVYEDIFKLITSNGVPKEYIVSKFDDKGYFFNEKEFELFMEEHREISKAGSEKKFKGGLAGHSDMEIKYHTATHLLHQALRDVLGNHVQQKGSNITPDRLRFDFAHGEKMTPEEKERVEMLVNEKIQESLPVVCEEMSLDEARKLGAIGLFGDKYGDTVTVYRVGTPDATYSLEFCGGPHVENTSELGHFRIKKEEASSAGVRRIKAVLE